MKSGINVIVRYYNAMKKKSLAVAVYDGMLGFEYGIVAEFFGLIRPGLENVWYDFKQCRVERGELTTTHGFSIRPKYGLKEIEEAHTVIVPGWETSRRRQTAYIAKARLYQSAAAGL